MSIAKPSIIPLHPIAKVRRAVHPKHFDLTNVDDFEDMQEACEVAELRLKVLNRPLRQTPQELL